MLNYRNIRTHDLILEKRKPAGCQPNGFPLQNTMWIFPMTQLVSYRLSTRLDI
jgi:hypothetical protein